MWLEVQSDGYEIGDPVEVMSRGGRESPFVARIAEVLWDRRKRLVNYRLEQNGTLLPKSYVVEQFRMVRPINGQISYRQLQLLERNFLRG